LPPASPVPPTRPANYDHTRAAESEAIAKATYALGDHLHPWEDASLDLTESYIGAVCEAMDEFPVPPTPTPQADRDQLEIDVEELLIDHCGVGGTSTLTDRILALTDAFAAPAPPSTPAERAPAAIVDDGEVILAAEGDGYVLTVQINEAGDSVSHRLTAAEVAAFAAVPPTRPGADAVIRALIAACPSYGRGEGDTFHIEESAVVRMAREFLAVAPPTPTPCPYIVTGGEGTSYCSLAERSAMHAAAPPSTPADPRPTDLTGSEA